MREKIVARTVDVSKLRLSKLNPRRSPGDVDELAASIRRIGILQPLVVSPDGNGGYLVLAGQRRLAAAKRLKLRTVPCVVRRMSERDREIAMLSENAHRRDLTPLEEATVYVRLMKLHGLTQAGVAEVVGFSQAHVSLKLAYLRLPKDTIAACEKGEISFSEAMGLGRYRDYSIKPKALPRGLPVTIRNLHTLEGHESCDGRKCEVRRLVLRSGL